MYFEPMNLTFMESSKLPFIMFKRFPSSFKKIRDYSCADGENNVLSAPAAGKLFKVLFILFFIYCLSSESEIFSQTIFTASTSGNWTTLAWTKSGTVTTATYPGQPGYGSEIHDVVISGASVLVTLNNSITASVRDITVTGASLAITSNTLTMTGSLSGNGSVSFTTGTINIAGDNLSNGTFSGSNGTMNYNGGNQTVRGGIIYYNLVISGTGTKTLSGNTTVNHDLTINSSVFQTGSRNCTVTGLTTIAAGGVFTTNSNLGTKSFNNMVLSGGTVANSSGSPVTMNLAGNLLVNGNAVSIFSEIRSTVTGSTVIDPGATLSFGGSSGNKTFSGLVTINGSWDNSANEAITLSNGLTFNGTSFISGTSQYTFTTFFQNISGTQPVVFFGNVSVTTPAVVNNRTIVTLKGGLTGTGTWRNDNGSGLNYEAAAVPGISNFNASTNSNYVKYSLSGDQEVRSGTYYHLQTAGSGIKSLKGAVTASGNLHIGPGTTLDAGTGNYAISVRGSWQNDGVFNERSGSVAFTGTGPQSLITTSGSSERFYNLEFNSTGPVTSDVDLAVDNILTMTKGVIMMTGKKLKLGTGASDPGTLIYSGGWISGIFSRWIIPANNNTNLIFPVGSATYYRGMILNFQTITVAGMLEAVFTGNVPPTDGLPLFEDIYYLNQLFPEGYWNVEPDASFSFTGMYDIALVPSGFNTFPVDAFTRIVSGVNGGDWSLNGSHVPGSPLLLERKGFSSFCNNYAIAYAEICEATFQNCPSDISVNALPGECQNTVTWTPPSISVPCPAYSVTSNYNPGDPFSVGTTQVVYILKNGTVEADFCTFYVTVRDNGTPVITCTGNQVRNVDPGACHYTVTGNEMDPVYAFNNCPFTLTNDLTGSSSLAGAQIQAGTTTVLWTISGMSGNSATCSMDIIVNDNIAPAIAPVSDRVENVDAGCSFTVPDYRLITAVTDNCGTPVVSQLPVPGTVISGAGTTQTITITAVDAFNNVSGISFKVTLTDNTPPIALCRNITRSLDPSGNVVITASDVNNGSTDNCGIASMNINRSSFTCADKGTNNIILTVTDGSGNFSTCVATVTITDNIAPSVICATDITRNTDPGLCSATVNVPAAVINDNCSVTTLRWALSGATTAVSPLTGINQIGSRAFNTGVTTVTYTVADGSGNQSTCSFLVTVTDNQNPVVICPADISSNTDAGLCTASVTVPDAIISDNCSVNTLIWTLTGATVGSSPVSGINQIGSRIFNTGISTISYKIRDNSGNESTCSFTVTVTDNIPPVIVCPGNISGACDISSVPPYTDIAGFLAAGGTATDNCALNTSAFVLLSQTSDGLNCPETFTRVYQISDVNGNLSSCTQTITIDDITPPVITGTIAPVTATGCSPGDAPAPAATVAALESMGLNITDNCTDDVNLTVSSSDNISGTCPVVIARTYNISDACGNSSSVIHLINVNDNTAPVISGSALPLNIEGCSVTDAPAPAETVAALEAMGWMISDGCTPDAALTVSSSDVITGNCPLIITRTYSITDVCGNFSTAVHTINIDDNTLPSASVPAPLTVDCAGNVPAPDINLIVDENDNCGMAPVVTFVNDISDGKTCPEIITRTYRVTDACGNYIDLRQVITIDDNINPTAGNPLPVVVECATDIPAPDINAVTDEADNCGIPPVVTFVSDVSDGNSCPEIITRTYRVTDQCGNFIDVIQLITVDDNTKPTAGNPVPLTFGCTGDIPAPDINVITDEADNCGTAPVVTYIGDITDGNTCPEIITRTYRVTDMCGNYIDVTQLIIIDDNTVPEATAPAPFTVECPGDIPVPDVNLITDETDNCGIPPVVTFVSDVSDGNTCPEIITRTYRVTDQCGNYIDVIQTITVEDKTLPVIIGTLAALNAEGCKGGDAPPAETTVQGLEALGLSISDNCTDDANLTVTSYDVSAGSCPVVVTRTYIISDACGNTSENVQTINITDTSIPVINGCPADMIVSADPGKCNAIVAWPDFIITDNCGPLTVTSSHASGSTFPAGSTVVTLTLTDNCGNLSSCSFTVTVNDTELPLITCPASITKETDHLLNTASVTLPDAVFSDNCSVSAVTWSMTGATTAVSPLTGINQIGTYTFNEGVTTVTFSATDASGNITTCSFQVAVVPPAALRGDIVAQVNVACFGDATGSVTVAGSGGYGTYEYKIDAGTFQSSGSFSNLSAGTYIVTVKDEDNTTFEVPVTISQPAAAFSSVITAVQNVTCSGKADGMIDVTSSGGTTPYSYTWNGTGGFTSALEDLNNLNPGSYSLTVTDANGCGTFTLDAVINEPSPLVITIDSHSDYNGSGISCFDGDNGSIATSASGGNGSYNFLWTGPSGFSSSSDDIDGLKAGSYSLAVTDAKGCLETVAVNLTEPAAVTVESTVTAPSCPDAADGSIELTITGGSQPYDIIWDNGATSQVRENILPGTYTVVVRDLNSCAVSTEITIEATGGEACLEIPQIITPNNDNFNDTWKIRNIDLFPDAEVQVFNRWGKRVYQSRNILADPWDGTDGGKPLPTDSYHYILDLHNGSGARQGVITVIR